MGCIVNVKIFTLKFETLSGGFDDAEVRTFIADKEVLSIHDHAFVHHGLPHLALVVLYHANCGNAAPVAKIPTNERDESWRKTLTEADMPLFNTLREWRSGKSREEGVPTYFVCTNKQLADVIRARPGSMAALSKIDGFGEGRLKKYGQDILAIMGRKPAPPGVKGEKIAPTPERAPDDA